MSRAQLNSSLVSLVLIAVALVLLLLTSSSFADIIKGVAKKSGCEWSFALNSLIGIQPECKAKLTSLSLSDIAPRLGADSKKIDEWHDLNKKDTEKKVYDKILETFPYRQTKNEDTLYEYAMDEYIAKSMKSCWDKVWKGELPIFDEWWNTIDTSLFADKEQARKLTGDIETDNWFFQTYDAPVQCVVCERIKFGDDIKKKFQGRQIQSLSPWMDFHPVLPRANINGKVDDKLPYDNTPYSKYVLDDVHRDIFHSRYVYTTDEPYAILYSRINIFKAAHWTEKMANWVGIISDEEFTQPVNMITIVPYREVGERCHALVI